MPYKNKQDLYDYQVQRWINRKKDAINHKGGVCESCGYDKFYGALEFHHKDPSEKDFNWNRLRLRTWSSVIHELEKCRLLCSNCHREEHHRMNIE